MLVPEAGTCVAARAPHASAGRATVLALAPQELVLYGMRLILGGRPWVERLVAARSVERAVALGRVHGPSVALVDMKLADGSAEAACQALRRAVPGVRVLLLATTDHVPSRTVAGTGASGFVAKGWPARQIVATVRAACEGAPLVQPGRRRVDELSARQQEVLHLLADGGTNHEIARVLHLSPNTVKQHTSAVYRKLDVRNRAEAIGRAQAMGLLA